MSAMADRCDAEWAMWITPAPLACDFVSGLPAIASVPLTSIPREGRLQNARLCSTQQHQNSSYHAYAGEIQGGNHSKMFWVPAYSVDFMAALSACTGKLYSIV